jgi:SAM-dependent methyltransferase
VTPQSVSFDRIADRYDETRGGERRGQVLAAEMAPYLGNPTNVLEVGVGTGIMATAFTRLGHSVVGVDIAADMLSRAHERVGSRVARADAHALPVPAESVDAAYLVWVLHVVADPTAVVDECARVLRPGGRLLAVAGRPRSDGAADITQFDNALDPIRDDRPDTADAVAHWGTAAGLERVAYRELEEHALSTPSEYADVLEKRTFSFMWDLDDRAFEDMVQPVIDGLRSLPDPTRPRDVVLRRDLLVFEKTGS